jgi:ParB/RepB/Spo0J family partition protein
MNRNTNPNHDVLITVPLSKLAAGRRNPRRVKLERDAHRRLVASIRAHGLLAPLVIQPDDKNAGAFRVIAGNRRLAALREAYKDAAKPPKVPCVLRAVDDQTADALALAENFVREPMHPLDEAEAFARLAREEAKGVRSIAAEFGVSEPYVRQRMKLATLADPVKAAYRQGGIDTGTAEAFASVPAERQAEVWQETGGSPQHAQHVRNIIAHAWIDATSAIFDVARLPEGAVSSDLFAERVLVERQAFMEAQAEALLAERQALIEDGWAEVVVGPQADVQDRLWSMDTPPVAYDDATTAALAKLDRRRRKWEAKLEQMDESDEAGLEAIGAKIEALDDEERKTTDAAPIRHSEATKSVSTAFLILDPDGRVRREYRTPRRKYSPASAGKAGGMTADSSGPMPPTPVRSPDDLVDSQLATTFTHQAIGVREALLNAPAARKRVLAMILHERVHSEALSVRHDANSTTITADHTEGFTSPALVALRKLRVDGDPFYDQHYVPDHEAYERLKTRTDEQLDFLIDLCTVEFLTAHLQRPTRLVWQLAEELGVNVRNYWRPDAAWLTGYRKIQLAGLVGELRGPAYSGAAERRKKTELVDELAALFTHAAEGKLADPALAERVNQWLPSNLRPKRMEPEEAPDEGDRQEAA